MGAEGFILKIDDKLIANLQKADEAIVKLDKHTTDAYNNMKSAFDKINGLNLNQFIQTINDVKDKLSGLSDVNIKINATGLDSISNMSKEAMDSVIKLTQSMSNIATSGKPTNALSSSLFFDLSSLEQQRKTFQATIADIERQISSLHSKYQSAQKEKNNIEIQVKTIGAEDINKLQAHIENIKSVLAKVGNESGRNISRNVQPYIEALHQLEAEIEKVKQSESEMIAGEQARPNTAIQNILKQYDDLYGQIRTIMEADAVLAKEMADKKAANDAIQAQIQKIAELKEQLKQLDVEFERLKARGGAYISNGKLTQESQDIIAQQNAIKEEIKLQEMTVSQAEKSAQEKIKIAQKETAAKIAEYDKILKKIKEYEAQKLQAESIKSTSTNVDVRVQAIDAVHNTEQQIQELNARRVQLENELGSQLIQVQQKYLSQELAEYEKNTNAKIAEYDKLLAKIREVEQEKNFASELSATTEDVDVRAKADTSVQESEKQIQELNKRKLELENELQGRIDAVRQKYRDKELRESVKAAEQAAKEAAQAEEKYRKTFAGAIDYSKNAKNILEERQAVKYLEAAREKLDKTDANYARDLAELNNRILQHNRNIKNAVEGSRELQTSHRSLMDISGQLARKLALVFSVSQIQGYIQKLVEVRGEFELNQKALRAMLQNTQMADNIWAKTVELAVQSPFRVKELVSYTKQLAAYRIEADKLYDTNKMLADISAGLGVDMQRLILAFGQVRSAAYLRGTEVRQFTEAGIPILEQLSKYFSELEGEAVSVGEVFDRISKRMVTFADVEEIFKRMTSEGGTFYKMQEIQSETLRGMLSNLHDSFDIMLNDIGKANESTIKWAINGVRTLVENWEYFVPVLKTAVAYIAAMGVKSLVTNKRLIALAMSFNIVTEAGVKQLKITQLLNVAWKSLTKSMANMVKGLATFAKSNPWLVAITAVLGVLAQVYRTLREHKAAINEITKEYDEMRKSVESISVGFTLATERGDFDEQKKRLQQLLSTAEKDFNIKIGIDWSEVTPENIITKFEELRQKIFNLNAFSMQFSTKMQEATEWTLQDDIYEDLDELGSVSTKTFNEMINESNRVVFALQEMKKAGVELTEEQVKALDLLSKPQAIDQSPLDYAEKLREGFSIVLSEYNAIQGALSQAKDAQTATRLRILLNEASESLKRFDVNAEDLNDIFSNWDKYIKEAEKEFNSFIDTIDIQENLPDEEKVLLLKTAIDTETTKKGWNEFVRDYIYRWTEQKFGIKFTANTEDIDNSLKGWQKSYEDLFKGKSGFFSQISMTTKQSEVIESLNTKLKETKDIIDKINAAGGVRATQAGGAYEGKNLDELKKSYEQIIEQLKWFGAYEENSGKDSNKTNAILNKRINLLKEVRQEYLKLRNEYDKEEASKRINESYADAFDDAFSGTGVSINRVVKQISSDLDELGDKTGSILTDEVKKKIEELKEAGTYIRTYTESLVEEVKHREGFSSTPYKKKNDVWTIGYGETRGVTKDTPAVTKEQADAQLRLRLTRDFAKELNDILDLNKDIVLTQEQYNQLLDLTYQGGAPKVESLIEQSRDVEKGVKAIQNTYNMVKKFIGEEAAERFGDAFVQKFRDAETIYERMALLLQTRNLYVTDEKTKETIIDKNLYAGMQARSDSRSRIFSGDLDIASAIEQTLISISTMDFTSVEGMIDAFEALRPIAEKEGKEAVAILEKVISSFKAEVNLEVKKSSNQKIKDDIDELFDKYELSLEIDKIGLPKDVAEKFIGSEMLDLDALKEEVISKYSEIGDESAKELSDELNKGLSDIDWIKVSELTSENISKDIKQTLEKIDELEKKDAKRRFNTYVNYLKEEMSERVKLRIETLKKIKEIEESKEFNPDQKKRIISAVKEESKQQEQKMDWEDFKGSDMYTMMFEDVEYLGTKALETLKSKLDEFKASLSDLPASDVKEIMQQIEKIEDVTIKRNPFKALSATNKEVRELKKAGKTEDVLQEDYIEQSEKVDQYQEELDIINTIISAKERALGTDEEAKEAQKTLNEYAATHSEYTSMSVEELTKVKGIIDGNKKTEEKNLATTKKQLDTYKKSRKEYAEAANKVQQIGSEVDKAFSATREILESVGVESDSVAGVLLEAGQNMTSLIFSAIQMQIQLKAMGIAANSALGIIGWIAIALQAIATLLKAIFSAKDKALEKQVDAQKRKVEELQKAYEKLEKAMDDAYSLTDIKKTNDEMKKNLELQIAAQKAAIAAQEQRKKANKEGSDAWKELQEMYDKLDEMYEQQAERWEDTFSKVTDGILDNVLDAAREFTDAWWDAFQETGDGLSGLEESFDEMISNMIKQQATLTISQGFFERWKKSLQSYINEKDIELTTEEAKKWYDEVKSQLPALSESLENAWGAIAEIINSSSSTMSGLEKGIGSMTEETAEILAAYANSIRFINQASDDKLAAIQNIASMSLNQQSSILDELRSQTKWIQTIYDFLGGMTISYPNGGIGFKVVM